MTGVLNEMRQTNRLITKEAVFHYSEQKTRSVMCVLVQFTCVWLKCVWGLNTGHVCVLLSRFCLLNLHM